MCYFRHKIKPRIDENGSTNAKFIRVEIPKVWADSCVDGSEPRSIIPCHTHLYSRRLERFSSANPLENNAILYQNRIDCKPYSQ